MGFKWGSNGVQPAPVRASHSETVLSPDAVATLFEYGWKQTALTLSTCPRRVCLHRSELISHSLTVWSIDAEARKSPNTALKWC